MLLACILAQRGLLQAGNADFRLTGLEGSEAPHDVDLDADLLDPVADLQLGGCVTQPRQTQEFGLGRRGVAQSGCAQRTRIGVGGFRLRVLGPGVGIGRRCQRQLGRGRPVATLERQPCRYGRIGVGGSEVVGPLADRERAVAHRLCRAVLPQLQMGIGQVVIGVQAVRSRGGIDLGRHLVCGNRIVPGPDTREDVRRHVLRVRGGRGDLAVALGRWQPLRGQGRVVVAVDQVVRGAGVLGLPGEDRLEQLGGTQLVAVLLVGRVEIGRQHQGVKDGRLAVFWVRGGHLLQSGLQRLRARAVVELVGVLEEDGQGIDIVALALSGQARLARLPHQCFTLGQRLGGHIARPDEGVVQRGQGARPVRHAAGRIGGQRALQWRPDLLPGEGMVVRHGQVEFTLGFGIAADLEVDAAELPIALVGCCGKVGAERCGGQCGADQMQVHAHLLVGRRVVRRSWIRAGYCRPATMPVSIPSK